MAEEVKQEEKKCECTKAPSAILKVLLGLAFLALAVYLLIGRSWWTYSWTLIKACTGPFLILAGLITFAIAKE